MKASVSPSGHLIVTHRSTTVRVLALAFVAGGIANWFFLFPTREEEQDPIEPIDSEWPPSDPDPMFCACTTNVLSPLQSEGKQGVLNCREVSTMRRSVCWALALLSSQQLLGQSGPLTATADATGERQLHAILDRLDSAVLHHEASVVRKYYSPDYVMTFRDGSRGGFENSLRVLTDTNRNSWQRHERSDEHFRFYGSTAIATFTVHSEWTARASKRHYDIRENVTQTWIRRGAQWTLIVTQVTAADSNAGSAALDSVAEDRAIRRMLAQYDTSWIRHEPERRAKLFAADAEITNVNGLTRGGGPAALQAFGSDARYQAMYADAIMTFDSARVRFLSPVLASVDGYWSMTGARHPDGTPWPLRRGLLNLIMSKQSGEWLIQFFHNAEFPARP